ncbi:MAG: hypothetical protein J5777_01645 [Clostridiales bacterium]|nr:hypothetical protein [Clostridiales bacterium]
MSGKKDKKKAEETVSESAKEEVKASELNEEEKAEAVSEDTGSEEKDTEEKEEPVKAEDAESEEDSEEESSEEDSEEEDSEEDKKDSKTEAKKDPIPAIIAVVVFAIIISAILYYVLPMALVPSFGYTLEEFNTKLDQSDISKKMQAQYTTLTPAFKVVDKESIKEIWSIKGELDEAEQKRIENRFKPFVKTLAATAELENILVEANTRVSDGKLTRMCIYCTFDDSHMTMMMVHFGAILSNFTDDLTFNQAVSLIMSASTTANTEGLYYVRGDIGYKLALENIGGKLYLKMEIVPAKSLKAEQIKETIAQTTAASETVAASETTTAAPAA